MLLSEMEKNFLKEEKFSKGVQTWTSVTLFQGVKYAKYEDIYQTFSNMRIYMGYMQNMIYSCAPCKTFFKMVITK